MTVSGVTPWDEGLLEPALSFSASESDAIRVMAGPGTGKTFALMRRVSRLLQEGVMPTQIAVVTFTRTAAIDLKNELQALNTPQVELVRVGTLHSFCFETLQRNRVLALSGRYPRTLLKYEQRMMLFDLSADLKESGDSLAERLSRFAIAWSNLDSERPEWPEDPKDKQFEISAIGWLLLHQAILLDELVVNTWRFLDENPESDELSYFKHVIVDEYQDLNRADQAVVQKLSQGGELTIVGDPDQSIYSFRQANPDGMDEFSHHYPDADDHVFDQCRRCPKAVVDMAVKLISHNSSHSSHALKSMSDAVDGEIDAIQWKSLQAEAKGIAAAIKHAVDNQKVDIGKVLVLVPNRIIGGNIASEIKNAGLPVASFFSQDLLDGNLRDTARSKPARQFALLSLLANPKDRVSLRVLYGIGEDDLCVREWNELLSGASTLWDEINPLSGHGDRNKIPERFQPIYDQLETDLAATSDKLGSELFDLIFPKEHDSLTNFRAALRDKIEDEHTVEDVYKTIRTEITQPETPVDVDYVRVMTLHKSKGLTADFVVIAGFSAGLIPRVPRDPSTRSDEENLAELEEQRRLMYVALTRTRNRIILSSVKTMTTAEAGRTNATIVFKKGVFRHPTQTSQFYRELGPAAPSVIAGDDFIKNLT